MIYSFPSLSFLSSNSNFDLTLIRLLFPLKRSTLNQFSASLLFALWLIMTWTKKNQRWIENRTIQKN